MIFVIYEGKFGMYMLVMYLDDYLFLVGGCEMWGFLKKFVLFKLVIDKDMLIGMFDYGFVCVVIGIMGYKYCELDLVE